MRALAAKFRFTAVPLPPSIHPCGEPPISTSESPISRAHSLSVSLYGNSLSLTSGLKPSSEPLPFSKLSNPSSGPPSFTPASRSTCRGTTQKTKIQKKILFSRKTQQRGATPVGIRFSLLFLMEGGEYQQDATGGGGEKDSTAREVREGKQRRHGDRTRVHPPHHERKYEGAPEYHQARAAQRNIKKPQKQPHHKRANTLRGG